MQLPFTVEQFFSVFRTYNTTLWPAQALLLVLALLTVIFIALRRSWSGVAVSAILAVLWVGSEGPTTWSSSRASILLHTALARSRLPADFSLHGTV